MKHEESSHKTEREESSHEMTQGVFTMGRHTKTVHTLGPFDVSDVGDDILGDVVHNQGIPIVVKWSVNGQTKFAVVTKDRELGIACVGCFKPGMSLADDSRFKKVCSFVKHWGNNKGERCQKCKNVGGQVIETKAKSANAVVVASLVVAFDNNN